MTMKKRILSLLLLVVMLVGLLASCAYKYEKDDMSKYANFNADKFKATLAALEITDATFGHSEEARQAKVVDAIITALAGVADTGTRVKDKVIGDNDLVYYCYYVTGKDKDGNAFVGAASSMKESAAVKLQLGLSTTEGLAAKIEALLVGYDLNGKNYTTTTASGTAAEAGQIVYVTYSKVVDGVTTTYTNDRLQVAEPTGAPAEGSTAKTATTFLEALCGMKPTVKKDELKFTEGGKEVTYKNVTINWIVTGGTELLVNDYKPTETTSVNVVGKTAKVDLSKATELVYHVYPVYFIDVVEYGSADYTATLILKEILGDGIVAGEVEVKNDKGEVTTEAADGTLGVFTDNSYKAADGKAMNEVAKKLVELFETLAEKEKTYDSKAAEYDELTDGYKESDASQAEKDAVADAKEAMDTAKEEMVAAEADVDAQIAKLVACETADGKKAEDAIKADYFTYRYKALENSYKNTLKKSVAKAIYKAALESIEWKTSGDSVVLPKKAVKEAYNSIMDSYEYEYYEGTTSTKVEGSSENVSVPNYTLYESREAYLRKALGLAEDASKDDIKAAITAEAEAAVKDTVTVYILKAELEAIYKETLEITKEDVETFKNSINFILLQYYVGSNDVDDKYYKPALQLDKVMDFITEIDEDACSDHKDDNSDDKCDECGKDVDDKSVTFKHVTVKYAD